MVPVRGCMSVSKWERRVLSCDVPISGSPGSKQPNSASKFATGKSSMA